MGIDYEVYCWDCDEKEYLGKNLICLPCQISEAEVLGKNQKIEEDIEQETAHGYDAIKTLPEKYAKKEVEAFVRLGHFLKKHNGHRIGLYSDFDDMTIEPLAYATSGKMIELDNGELWAIIELLETGKVKEEKRRENLLQRLKDIMRSTARVFFKRGDCYSSKYY